MASDPARNALMVNIRGSGGKRGLRPVPRREKKHSSFIDVLKQEERKKRTGSLPTAASKPQRKTSDGASKPEPKKTRATVEKKKSVPSAPSQPAPEASASGPPVKRTTDDELCQLLDQIESEIGMDTELTQDLLDILGNYKSYSSKV